VTDIRIESGARLGGYRLERVLGRGGMGVVYAAEDLRLGRTVALKVLAPELSTDPAFAQRFLRETKIAASIDHPHVVPVFEAGEEGGVLYLAMRYVDGDDLRQVLLRDGRLDRARAARIVRQVAGALDVAHGRGLVHRDVKPGNVLLTATADGDHAYLADFGLTKEGGSTTALSETGHMLGTLAYMPPEQIRGEGVDGRADVYALGCVAYHCLAGRPPFTGTDVAVMLAHLQDAPPSIEGGHPALDALFDSALAKAREDRFPTCGGLAAALDAAVADSAIGARGTRRTQPIAGSVAIAHQRRDADAARSVAYQLERAGVVVSEMDGDVSAVAVLLGAGSRDELTGDLRPVERAVMDGRVRLVPVLLPGMPDPVDPSSLPPLVGSQAWVDMRRGITEDAADVLLARLHGSIARPPPAIRVASPYRGLRPFEEKDAPLFFGRDGDVQRPIELLKETSFLAVLGPSGSGKSSLVRAGLVPALRAGRLPGRDVSDIVVLKPGADPITALAAQVTRLLGRPADIGDVVDRMQADARTLQLLTALLGDADGSTRMVWVVDQFEEAFTLCRDEQERTAFIGNLLAAGSAVDGRAIVVVTMRADFYPRVASYPDLARAVGAHQYLVSPPDRSGLREAIEIPADLAGGRFEDGLVETILGDVGSEPGALPLLEHALFELWERCTGQLLTLSVYREVGGVEGAIAARAEAVYANLAPRDQEVLRRTMLRLTQLGEGTEDTRRRVAFAELESTEDDAGEVDRVVGATVDARLLTITGTAAGERWLEVSHEALIRAWPRLREWLDEDRAGLRLHRRLTEAAAEWQRLARDEGALYRGARLIESREWAAQNPNTLNPLEMAFLETGAKLTEREREEAERQRERELEEARRTAEAERRSARLSRVITAVVLAGLVVTAILAAFALLQRSDALSQKQSAVRQEQIALAHELAAVSGTKLENDPRLAVLLAIEAAKRAQTTDVRSALEQAVLAARLRGVIQLGGRSSVQISAAGRRILSQTLAGVAGKTTADVWDVATGKRLSQNDVPPNADSDMAFADHAQDLVMLDVHHHELVVDAATGAPIPGAVSVDWSPGGSWSPRGDRVLALDPGTQQLDLRTSEGTVIRRLGSLSGFYGNSNYASWSRDGRDVALDDSGTVVVYDGQSGRVLKRLPGPFAQSVSFAPSDRLLVIESRHVAVWNTNGWRLVRRVPGGNGIWSAASDAAGSRVAIPNGGRTYTVGIYELRTGQRVTTLVGDANHPLSVTMSPDGQMVAVGESDGEVSVWDVPSGTLTARFPADTQGVLGLHFSAAHPAALVTSGTDPVVRVWDASLGAPVLDIEQPSADLLGAVSSDGRVIVLGGRGVVEHDLGRSRDVTLQYRGGPPVEAAFSPDGRRAIVAAADGTAQVWNALTGHAAGRIAGSAPLNSVALSNAGVAMTMDDRGDVRTWDAATGHIVATLGLVLITDPPRFVADGRLVALVRPQKGSKRGCNSATASLVDPRTGDVSLGIGASEATGEGVAVPMVWVAPDGSAYTSRGIPAGHHVCRATLVGWSPSGSPINPAAASPASGRPDAISFSADGLAGGWASYSGKLYGDAMLWDASAGKQVRLLKGPEQTLTATAFSSDGKLFAAASDDQTAWIWRVANGHVVSTLRGHTGTVNDVAFTPDAQFVATAGQDGTVRVWRTATGQQVWQIQTPTGDTGGVEDVEFTGGGRFLVVVAGAGARSGTLVSRLVSPYTHQTVQRFGKQKAQIYRCDVCLPFDDLLRVAESRAVGSLSPKERAEFRISG
jgi:WD40 repeat protein